MRRTRSRPAPAKQKVPASKFGQAGKLPGFGGWHLADVFATLYFGCTHAPSARRLLTGFGNRNILVEGNHIEDSYGAAIEILNADGVLVRDNTIGTTFLRGSGFASGTTLGIAPDAAIIIAMARRISLVGNTVATGPVARRPVGIHASSDFLIWNTHQRRAY